MMKSVLLLFISSFLLLACDQKNDLSPTHDTQHSLSLRVKNDTHFVFNDVYIRYGDSEHYYNSLPPQEVSDYRKFIFKTMFGYPHIEVSTDNKDFIIDIQPTESYSKQSSIIEIPPMTCVITVSHYSDNALSVYFTE